MAEKQQYLRLLPAVERFCGKALTGNSVSCAPEDRGRSCSGSDRGTKSFNSSRGFRTGAAADELLFPKPASEALERIQQKLIPVYGLY